MAKPRHAGEAIARRRSPEGLSGNGERRADRPPPIAPRPQPAYRRRRSERDAPRPTGALDQRPLEHASDDRRQGRRLCSVNDTWADTTTPHGRLMLTVLGGLAEFERELIRARTGEGRERAKARGVKMGRRPKLTDHQKREALKRRDAGEPMREIARTYNVSHSTISRLAPGPFDAFGAKG